MIACQANPEDAPESVEHCREDREQIKNGEARLNSQFHVPRWLRVQGSAQLGVAVERVARLSSSTVGLNRKNARGGGTFCSMGKNYFRWERRVRDLSAAGGRPYPGIPGRSRIGRDAVLRNSDRRKPSQ